VKVAVTARGALLSSQVDLHFGRARYLLLVDTESGSFTVRDNSENLSTPHHAGMQGAGVLIGLGASVIITGHIGPKAFRTLQAGQASVYTVTSGSVKKAIEKLKAGELRRIVKANAEEHCSQAPRVDADATC
jgi:predicted Fe-Mo cluster-binding NifX family protein